MSKVVIGIGGLLGSGKDTVADFLVSNHGFTKLGMSDPLIEGALRMNPYIEYKPGEVAYDGYSPHGAYLSQLMDWHGYTKTKTFENARIFLQKMGTDFGREMIGENVWVDLARKSIENTEGNVVITGIRFPNEVEMVSDIGTSWWVDRRVLAGTATTAAHASETSVGPEAFDRVIYNHGTLSELYRSVDVLLGLY